MFRQFAIGRFMIGFIVFVLTYMVAAWSDDNFFKLLTVGMFVFSLYVMSEIQKGQQEELAKKDLQCEEKIREMQDIVDQKEAEYELLVQDILKSGTDEIRD